MGSFVQSLFKANHKVGVFCRGNLYSVQCTIISLTLKTNNSLSTLKRLTFLVPV